MNPRLKTISQFKLVRTVDKTEKSDIATDFLSSIDGEDNFETIIAVRILQVLSLVSETDNKDSGFDVDKIIDIIMFQFGCLNYVTGEVLDSLGLLSCYSLVSRTQCKYRLTEYGREVVETIFELSTIYPEYRRFTRRENESFAEHWGLIPGKNVAGKKYKHLYLVY